MIRLLAVFLALVLAVGCGGSGNPVTNPPGGDPISPGDATQLGGDLSSSASLIAAQSPLDALHAQAAALALQAQVKASSVNLAASLRTGPPDRAALSSGAARAFGFQLRVLNLPGGSGPQLFSGVLVFQGGRDWVLVGGPSPGSTIPPAIGMLGAAGQVWKASGGNESARLDVEGGDCQWLGTRPAYVTGCKYASFAGAGFAIGSSTPVSSGAAGSRTASLASGNLSAGISLTVDCALGTVCPGSAAPVSVSVTPSTASLAPGGTQQFAATVQNSSDTVVTWSILEANGGTVSASGLYQAPVSVAAISTFHVRGTSHADPSKYGQATVTVTPGTPPPVIVTVTPNPASVPSGGTRQFAAQVQNTADTVVTWSVLEAGGGTISSTGLYQAPTVASASVFHVRATSHADPGKHGDAEVDVSPGPGVVINGPTTVSTLGTLQLSATVTGLSGGVNWSIDENVTDYRGGSITTGGLYTAPGSPGTVHVRARAQSNPNVFAIAAITIGVGCMEALPLIPVQGSQTHIVMIGRIPLKVDGQGRPVVAWIEYAPFVTYVARYEDTGWHLLGASGLPANGTGGIRWADLAIDSQDRPVVAYEVFDSVSHQAEIWVATWGGSSWNTLSAPVPQGLSNGGWAMRLNAADQPVVAVSRNLATAPFRDIAVAQWTGSAWSVTGGIYATAGEQVFLPDLIIDAAGDITVAWEEQVPPVGGFAVFKPLAKKLSGPGAGLIPSPNTSNDYYEGGPALALDSSGKLAMAWSNYPDTTAGVFSDGLEVTTWSGAGWSQLGTTLAGLTAVVVPEHNGTPYDPHRLLRNPDTGMLAASTMSTVNDVAAIFEYTSTGAWPMVCAPMPDATRADDIARGNELTGLAYDTVNHGFVLAAASGNDRSLRVARIKH